MHFDDAIFERELRAVIFDMDGLLLDTETMAYQTWTRAAADCGYDLDDDLFKQLVGRTRRDSNEILRRAFGSTFDLDAFRERHLANWERLVDERGIPLKPGVMELLDALDEAGTPRAVATSTGRPSAVRCLTMAGIVGRFDVLVTGDQIERGKPAPDIFLLAAERLRVAPQACLVLEDSIYGIQAAHAAGMMPVMVPDLLEPTEDVLRLASGVLRSLHEVRSVFVSWRGRSLV